MTTVTMRRLSYALLFIAPACWAVNNVVGRIAPGEIGPHMLATCRWALAAALLALFSWQELASKRDAIPREMGQLVVLALLGMWICGAWVYIGAQTTVASNVALIYALSPVFIILAAGLWLRERITILQICGIALALAGLVHVVIKGDWPALGKVQFVSGDGWIVAAALSWALFAILLKRWTSAFSPTARLVLIAAVGAVVLAPMAVIETWAASAYGLDAYATTWGPKAIGYILLVAVFPGAGAYLAYATAQKHLGAARAGIALYLGPLFGALAGWLVLGEPILAHHLVGSALILPGIWLASRSA